MATDGSPEFVLIWKLKAMSSGAPICRLAASARRTGASGCSGWPTPDVPCGGQGLPTNIEWKAGAAYTNGRKVQVKLQHVAELASWPTPMAGSPGTEEYNPAGNTDSSRKTVELVSPWVTPAARDHKDSPHRERAKGEQLDGQVQLCPWLTPGANDVGEPNDGRLKTDRETRDPELADNYRMDLHDQVGLASGPTTPSSPAATEKRGVLNVEFTRWLQGYPVAWGCCGATAIASCRPARRSSSKRS